ncbi:hypothetical protein CEXT_312751 [Caerostris extrusa]|uniref:Uncharacterized protein n=1 Tax=Caerostris extrusa TaxID=172846 RepID=A0AAV4U8D9_CAEEX|nr:hypothetical protein CEXT_312751 [Caerostris extrusa]
MIPSTQSSPSERDVSPKDMGKRFTGQRESSFTSGVAVSLCPPTPPLLVKGVGAEMNPWNLKVPGISMKNVFGKEISSRFYIGCPLISAGELFIIPQ